MDWLNYHHFLYFWVVAQEGTIVKASRKLLLAQPTISGQIHELEASLGVKLFEKSGRGLVLTEAGQLAYRYADEIFSLGEEFVDTIKGRSSRHPLRLSVGIADVLPPSLVRRFLEPVFNISPNVQIEVQSDKSLDEFMAELVLYRHDVILGDRPANPSIAVNVFSHPLGDCGTSFFATTALKKTLSKSFPSSLDGAPFLLPGRSSAVRRSLDEWFNLKGISPTVVISCDDSALTKDLGAQGTGVFSAPTVIESEVKKQHRVVVVGRTTEVRQEFFAMSVERKIKHPAVKAMTETARNAIFSVR
ncbi:MAG: transcriptional activator NhaR [Planctomycetota bacterium]|jgi:LysR family transcriptional activator of nhaA